MNRRLRKKKFVGEFRELGFEVRAYLGEGRSYAELEAVHDRLIDLVEARELGFSGGMTTDELDGYITRMKRGSATEEDRAAIAALLEAETALVRQQVSALTPAREGSGLGMRCWQALARVAGLVDTGS